MLRKSLLLSSTLLVATATLAATAAAAQTEPTAVDEVVVTGTRIARPNLQQPTPVTVLTSTAFENSGTTRLGDALAQLPALGINGTVQATAASGEDVGGLSFADLRSLGVSRTLVLVDGKRHVGGDAGSTGSGAAVDLNSIPPALVDRVEITTGGASAIYGSDAVTGVVNIIMKHDFTGYQADVQVGGPMDGGYGQRASGSMTGGWSFGGDRGNFTLSGFWDRQDRVSAKDVRGLNNYARVINPADTGPNDGIADYLIKPYVFSDFASENGVILGYDFFSGIPGVVAALDANGVPAPQQPRIGDTDSFIYGAFSGPCATCVDPEKYIDLIPQQERTGAAASVRYDLSDHLHFTGDIKFVRSDSQNSFAPSTTGSGVQLSPDNAYLTPEIGAVVGSLPWYVIPLVSRLNNDIGRRDRDTRRETFRTVAALSGDFDTSFSPITWEASYNYGRTENRIRQDNVLIPGNFAAAIDAVWDGGVIKCRQDVTGIPGPGTTGEQCVPFNLFGPQNSAAAIDYVSHSAVRTQTLTQQVAGLQFTFDSSRWFNLPGGEIKFAGGVEYRKEQSESRNDAFVKSGLSELAPQPDASGGFNVKEAYLEMHAPILRDRPFFQRLDFDAAIRVADYSSVGSVTAWKAGGVWAPVRDLSLRATYSEAVRAPNITEAYLPATGGFFNVADPCSGAAQNDSPNRQANCAALGIDPGFVQIDTSVSGIASGNRNLDPEESKSWTAGFVYQPSFAPGLAISVDYYKIEIDKAITLLNPQDAAEKCVDGATLSSKYCDLITRDANHQITDVLSTFINQSKLETAGFDIQLTYAHSVADWTKGWAGLDGRVVASLTANRLEYLNIYAFEDFPGQVDRNAGEIGNPRWSLNASLAYQQGPWTFTWEGQYQGEVRRSLDHPLEFYDRPYVEAVWYHDAIVRYRFDSLHGTELYAGINNLFDKTIPYGLTGNGASASYDIFGRYAFAGIKARF
jgi:iron complex outermembrane receptor protein